jgi:SAM-dependent methyltransferase
MAAFKDHFSHHSDRYARFRPRYPEALFDWLASATPGRALAWDVATGSGQAASSLATRFQRVVATDPSQAQLAHATTRPNVEYRNEPAERSSLEDESVDLVTVAQALHWFDHEAFAKEVRRVLRPGGRFAAWSYDLLRIAPSIDPILDAHVKEVVEPFWPDERGLVVEGYASIPLAYPKAPAPTFELTACWDLDRLLGYLGTWSATQRMIRATGTDPIPAAREALARVWGDPTRERLMRWPLAVVTCLKPG